MWKFLTVIVSAVVFASGAGFAHAQSFGNQSVFVTNVPNIRAFPNDLQTWRTNPKAFSLKDSTTIISPTSPMSNELDAFSSHAVKIMKSSRSGQAQLRAKDGTVIDMFLGVDDRILFAPVTTPSAQVLLQYQKDSDNNVLLSSLLPSTGGFVYNTGKLDFESDDLPTFLNTTDMAQIGGQLTETLNQKTSSWSTVAIYRDGGALAVPVCTGVAVAPSLVISAAHCFCNFRKKPSKYWVNVKPQYTAKPAPGEVKESIIVKRFIPFETAGKPYCDVAGFQQDRIILGDIMLLELEQKIPNVLMAAKDQGLQIIADFAVASVVAVNQNIWKPRQCWFRTLGYGVGPVQGDPSRKDTQTSHLRRTLPYRISQEIALTGFPGVTVSEFDRENHAICPGDSGSGLFIPSEVSCNQPGNQANEALAGIASKIGSLSKCFVADSNGNSIFVSKPATVTRLDTPEVQAWLKRSAESIGESINFVDVPGPQNILAKN